MDAAKVKMMEELMARRDAAIAQTVKNSKVKDGMLAEYKKNQVKLNGEIMRLDSEIVAMRTADPALQRLSQKVG